MCFKCVMWRECVCVCGGAGVCVWCLCVWHGRVAEKGRIPLQIEPAVREGGQGDEGRKGRVAVLVERLAQLEQHVQHFPCHALAGGSRIIVIRIIIIIIAPRKTTKFQLRVPSHRGQLLRHRQRDQAAWIPRLRVR